MEPAQAIGNVPDLSQETDEDLLIYMTMREDDPLVAKEAWAEFYRRHIDYMRGKCREVCRGILAGSGPDDLAQLTFIKAYERANTFKSGGINDLDRLRLRVRAWLGRIAQNIYRDMLRGRKDSKELAVDKEDLEEAPEQVQAAPTTSTYKRLLDEAIDALSEKKQHVLRVTYQYNQPGKKHQRLPNHVAEELATTLNTTSDNVRQLRRRALQEVNQFIKSKTGAVKAADYGEKDPKE
jgi:RNA polymerase sigma factor (sigma-70 family)